MTGTRQSDEFRIAIIIPTRVGWPDMHRSVDAVVPQLAASGGQLIVVDASGKPAAPIADGKAVHWLSLPGRPSYALRQAGYRAARAPIMAITEDHCAPSATWLADVLAEHQRAPDAAGIFGLVDNGSRDHLVDWALFAVGYLAWAPPAPAARGAPGHANLSFKSWVFDALPPRGDQVLEFRYVVALRAAGYVVLGTERTRVTHFQSAGLVATAQLMFHNGRAIAGLRRTKMEMRDWLRTLAPGLVAAFRTLRTARLASSKPDIEQPVRRSLPIVAVLHLAHTIGESVGYLGGAGRSGHRLH